ncbi:MAG: VanZ family protein [Phycisphaeraceae bacterium]
MSPSRRHHHRHRSRSHPRWSEPLPPYDPYRRALVTLRRLVIALALLTLWLLMYPLNFVSLPRTAWLAETDLHKLDVLSNLLLFVPLAALAGWYGWARRASSEERRTRNQERGTGDAQDAMPASPSFLVPRSSFFIPWSVVLTTLAGVIMSLAGETAQRWLPDRQSSVVDLLVNTLGAAVAASAGYALAPRLHPRLVFFLAWLRQSPQARRLLWLVAAVLILRLAPFDISAQTRELKMQFQVSADTGAPFSATVHALKEGTFSHEVLGELARAAGSFLLFAVLAWGVGRAWREHLERHGDRSLPGLAIVVVTGGAALATEWLQWPIQSRVMDATDLVGALAGVLLGAMIDAGIGRVEPRPLEGIADFGFRILDWESKAIPAKLEDSHGRAFQSEIRNPKSEIPLSRRRWVTFAALLSLCAFGGMTALAIANDPDAPYNLRELIGSGPAGLLRGGAVTLAMLLIGLAPAAIARRVNECRDALWRQLPALAAAVLVAAGLVTLTMPPESLHDLVGAPIWSAYPTLEIWLRLAGLLALPMSALLLAAGFWDRARKFGTRSGLRATARLLIAAGIAWVLGRTVVITWASTDNLTELIRGGGDPFLHRITVAWPGELWLGLLLLLLAAHAGLVAVQGMRLSRRGAWILATLLATLILAPLSLGLFQAGTVGDLQKYGTTFSTEQFLLGASRQATLGHAALLARWSGLYMGMVLILGLGGMLGLRLVPSLRLDSKAALPYASWRKVKPTPEDRRQSSGQAALLFLALALTALAVYGSLVPLTIQRLSWHEAVEQYRQIWSLPHVTAANRADLVTNMLLFGALAFAWLAALSPPQRGRLAPRLAAPLVTLAVVALGAALEFAQLYIPQRTSSGGDVVAQMLGAAIGVGLWLTRGHAWADRLRQLVRGGDDADPDHGRTPWQALLEIYLAGYLLYAIMPLDPALSLTEWRTKWAQSQLLIIPFTYPWQDTSTAFWELFTDIVLAIPLGWLLAIWCKDSMHRAIRLGLLIVIAVELVQLPLVSRVSDITDILTGMMGIVIGLFMAQAPMHRVAGYASKWYVTAAGGYALMLLIAYTYPWRFDFLHVNPYQLYDRLLAIPFVSLYYESSLGQVDQMIRNLLLAMPIGLLVGWAVPRRDPRWWPLASISTLLSMGLFTFIEVCQAFIPQRFADSTHILLSVLGMMAGLAVSRVFRRSRRTGESRLAASPRARAL